MRLPGDKSNPEAVDGTGAHLSRGHGQTGYEYRPPAFPTALFTPEGGHNPGVHGAATGVGMVDAHAFNRVSFSLRKKGSHRGQLLLVHLSELPSMVR